MASDTKKARLQELAREDMLATSYHQVTPDNRDAIMRDVINAMSLGRSTDEGYLTDLYTIWMSYLRETALYEECYDLKLDKWIRMRPTRRSVLLLAHQIKRRLEALDTGEPMAKGMLRIQKAYDEGVELALSAYFDHELCAGDIVAGRKAITGVLKI